MNSSRHKVSSRAKNTRRAAPHPLSHESHMQLRTVAVVAATLSSSLFAQAPSGKRGITAEDYLQFELVSDPRVSPDGSQVVYVVSRVDRAQNRRIPSVWIASTDGARAPRVLLDESWSPSAPRWSPDGTSIAFISSHAAGDTGTAGRRGPAPRAQLWVVATSSGSPRRVTTVANGVSNCVWSPNGARSICLSRTGPSDAWPAGKERSDVRHYTQSSYKFNDNGWFDDRRSHLWTVEMSSGAAKQITNGDA